MRMLYQTREIFGLRLGWFFKVLLMASCLLSICSGSIFARTSRVYHVLVINSLQQGVPWTINNMAHLEHTLISGGEEVQLHIDYMHTKQLSMNQNYMKSKSALFAREFKKLPLDLIVCIGSDALRFLLDKGDKLFPGIPVFFGAVGMGEAQRARRHPNYEGISCDWNLEQNIELALGLFPHTKEVVFVHDNTTIGRELAADALSLSPDFPETKFTFISNATIKEVIDRVHRLRPGSVLFMLSFSIDKAGEFFVSDRGMRKIVAASQVPSFGLWEFQSDEGIIGGLLINERQYGKMMARYVLQILRANGLKGLMAPRTTPAQYVFDWTQLQRFEHSSKAIPANYVTINKPDKTKETYKNVIFGVLGLLIVLVGVVTTLSMNIIRRKRAEEALRKSEERLNLAMNATSDGIWDWTIMTGVLYCSPRCYTMLGYNPGEIPSFIDYWWTMIHPDDVVKATKVMQAHLGGQTPAYEAEYRIRTKDGGWRWVFAAGRVVARDHYGRALRMVGTLTDITNRKEAEEERLEFERKLDEQKRQFYRETISSVTGGKLVICEHSEIDAYIERAEVSAAVESVDEAKPVRCKVEAYFIGKGLDADRTSLFMMGVGEAITNAIKHASGGKVYAGADKKAVWAAVRDEGKGIESLLIPKVVLLQGYSTKPSLGLGYTIMLDVSDHMLLATGEGGTTVLLAKCFQEVVPTLSLATNCEASEECSSD